MSRDTVYRRILRRETHSPRSVLAIAIAVVAFVVLAWVGVEVVLAILNRGPLLAAPFDMFSAVVALDQAPAGIVVPAGIGAVVVGVILIGMACTPGRRARHVLPTERVATVVDNEVIASALARRAARAANVDPDNAVVSVSHRRAVVDVVPTSGLPVDRDAVHATVVDELSSYGVRPAVTARIRVAQSGKVGS
jgi:hypothetical protein